MISKINLIIIATILIIVSSCTINSNRMLRTPKNYEYDKIENELSELEYQIDVNDQLTFQLYTNNGFQLIDMFSATASGGVQTQRIQNGAGGPGGGLYLVRIDSLIEFPIIGDVNLVGKTIKEAEIYLENIFSEFYVDPFIVLGVSTRRVFLFSGSSGGEASVVNLGFNNMTLFEVLASAGGISSSNSSKKIKIIRRTKEGIKIFNADLSTINGINEGNMIMQSHDIIYITPNFNLGSEIAQDINSVFSFISTISIVWLTLTQINQ
ncbi:MAG: polysaccharide biosynthesis/export family protein [Flavobacteriales bacterium]|nr:polysaccharide biosynthesis/export family protein [Flavobacteriales bacterium]